LEFNKRWIPLTFANLKDNGSWYCWGIDEPLMDIYSNILKPMIKRREICFRNLITWDKGNGQGQTSEEFRMYPIADEKCLFVMVGWEAVQGFTVNSCDYSPVMEPLRSYLEGEIKRLGENDETIANALGWKCGRTVNHWYSKSQFALPTKENYEALRAYGIEKIGDADFLKREYDLLKREFYAGRSFFDNTHDNMNNVWHFQRVRGEEREDAGGHATPKPLALCARGIKTSSREGEIVLDVFGGSGSTMIACEQLGRKCRMMELDPHYCDVIIARWEKLTGQTAVKVDE
jgi:adenine specific DNA methylase Mod